MHSYPKINRATMEAFYWACVLKYLCLKDVDTMYCNFTTLLICWASWRCCPPLCCLQQPCARWLKSSQITQNWSENWIASTSDNYMSTEHNSIHIDHCWIRPFCNSAVRNSGLLIVIPFIKCLNGWPFCDSKSHHSHYSSFSGRKRYWPFDQY